MGDTSRSNWIFEIPIPFVWRALMARHRCSALMRSQACPASFLRKHWKSGAPCYQLNKEMHLTCSYISLWGCPRAHHTNIRMRTHISRERCCQATRSSPPPAFSFHYIFVFCGCYQRWKEGKGSSKSSTSLFCCPCESMCCLIMFWCFLYYIVIILITCSFFFF